MTTPRTSLAALCAVSVLLPGCAARPAATTPAPVPPALGGQEPPTVVPREEITTPSIYKAYYVGQIIDPTHPELMYRPGVVYRQEISERWNRNPAANRGAVSGVISGVADPALLAPVSAEQQQLIAQQREAMELLAEENDRLRASADAEAETDPAAAPAAEPATAQATPPVDPDAPAIASTAAAVDPTREAVSGEATVPAEPVINFNQAILPNSDGVIALSPELLEQIDRSEPNPFVRRHQLETQYRNLEIALTGTAPGPRPTATVNGRLVNVGDSWEGFRIVAINRDALYLQRHPFLLQIPLARERAVTVRLPQ